MGGAEGQLKRTMRVLASFKEEPGKKHAELNTDIRAVRRKPRTYWSEIDPQKEAVKN